MAGSVRDVLRQMIAARGPIPVSTYMQTCLLHPTQGYYVTRDPLGVRGDFTTSPEISQMFGELVGINLLTQWFAMGSPKQVRIAELGPGRGTLMADVLRTLRTFKQFSTNLRHVALVEASPALREKQQTLLNPIKGSAELTWHDHARELPADGVCTFVLAHEFFDALPINQYTKTLNGGQEWEERLVSYNTSLNKFEFVRGGRTAMSAVLQANKRYGKLLPNAEIEVCPQAQEHARVLSSMIRKNTGSVLVADYGPSATVPVNTFRAFANHKQLNPLDAEPGQADLTADVDFMALKNVFELCGLHVSGPVSQRDWLHRMGIGARATMLYNSQKQEEAKQRVSKAYQRLTDAGGMGKTYKFLNASSSNFKVEGFYSPEIDQTKQ